MWAAQRTAVRVVIYVNIDKGLSRQLPNPRVPLQGIAGRIADGWEDLLNVMGRNPRSRSSVPLTTNPSDADCTSLIKCLAQS